MNQTFTDCEPTDRVVITYEGMPLDEAAIFAVAYGRRRRRERALAGSALAIMLVLVALLAAACLTGCSAVDDKDAHSFAADNLTLYEGVAPVSTLSAVVADKVLELKANLEKSATAIVAKTPHTFDPTTGRCACGVVKGQ